MDPTVTVNRIRELALTIIKRWAFNAGETEEAIELAECFEALDGWLTKNGALPEQWKYKDK